MAGSMPVPHGPSAGIRTRQRRMGSDHRFIIIQGSRAPPGLRFPMPELPEVEVTRLSFLRPHRREARVLAWPGQGAALAVRRPALQAARWCGVRRRGKYLLLDLDRGLLLIHLRMSVAWPSTTLPSAGPHDHFDLQTSQGLALHDPRRFGAVVFAESEPHRRPKLLGRIWVEPVGRLRSRRTVPCRPAVRARVDQKLLLGGGWWSAGGNIYACRRCSRGIRRPPRRPVRFARAARTRAMPPSASAGARPWNARRIDLCGTSPNASGTCGERSARGGGLWPAGLEACRGLRDAHPRDPAGQRSTLFLPVPDTDGDAPTGPVGCYIDRPAGNREHPFNDQFDQRMVPGVAEFGLRLKLLAEWMKDHELLDAGSRSLQRLEMQVRRTRSWWPSSASSRAASRS